MVDIVLWICRIILIILLYIFLFMVIRTGVGLVKDQRKKGNRWSVEVVRGPKELKNIKIAINGPVVVGRSPGADMVIADSFVSGRHAQFTLIGNEAYVEDLGSTNGTLVNDIPLTHSMKLNKGDIIRIGDVEIKVSKQ